MFPELTFVGMSDEQIGLDLDLPDLPEAPLPPREQVYVQQYCANGLKGTAAARAAGYKHEAVASSRLLKRPRIQAAIARELQELLADGRASKEALLLKLASIVHADLADLARHLQDPDHITLSDLKDLPPEVSAAIRKMKVRTSEKSTGMRTETETTVDLELHDPKAAAELIAKILKYVGEQVDVTSGGKPLAAGVGGSPIEIVVRRIGVD
jgi:hypothetical protein